MGDQGKSCLWRKEKTMTLTHQLTHIWTRKLQCGSLWGLRTRPQLSHMVGSSRQRLFHSTYTIGLGKMSIAKRGLTVCFIGRWFWWPDWSNLIHNQALLVLFFTFVNALLSRVAMRRLLLLGRRKFWLVRGCDEDESRGGAMIFLDWWWDTK